AHDAQPLPGHGGGRRGDRAGGRGPGRRRADRRAAPPRERRRRRAGGGDPRVGRRGRPDPAFAGNLPRRASDEPPRRIAGGSHEAGPFRRAADASAARRLSRQDRSRGRRDHPPGRAGCTSSGCGRDRRHERPRDEHERPRDKDNQARAGPNAHGQRHGDPQMTIRSGGGPRDTRQAHPLDPRAYDDAWQPDDRTDGSGSGNGYGTGRSNGYGNGRSRRGSGGGHHGILRFLVFALVLAAIVLVSLVTVLRPVVQGAVVDWASDNPGALGISFVADMVRADLGPKLTDPASTDTEQVNFTIGSGETATTIAQRLETEGFLAHRP